VADIHAQRGINSRRGSNDQIVERTNPESLAFFLVAEVIDGRKGIDDEISLDDLIATARSYSPAQTSLK
jgi:hypothetical protein